MARKRNQPEPVLEIEVGYGNVNVGETTARLGLKVSRGNLTVTQADRHLVGKRLTGTILARAGGAQAGQASLPGTEGADIEIRAVFDVKGFSAGLKSITFGLTVQIESIDIAQLSHFAKRDGTFTVEAIEQIPEAELKGKNGDDEEAE